MSQVITSFTSHFLYTFKQVALFDSTHIQVIVCCNEVAFLDKFKWTSLHYVAYDHLLLR